MIDHDDALSSARGYLAVQAVAGSVWWIAVFLSDEVREGTLGEWNPGWLVAPDAAFFVIASAWAAVTANRYAAAIAAGWTTAVTIALAVYGLVESEAGWGVVAMVVATVGTVVSAVTIWFGRFPTGWFFVGPFAFHPADDAPRARHVRRGVLQLLVFWTVFFVVVPVALSLVEHRLGLTMAVLQNSAWVALGWVLFAAGSAVGLWSCLTVALFGNGTPLPAETASQLVIRGPYAYVRNPMAVAGAAQTIAVGLILGSWSVIAIAAAGAVLWNIVIRPVEEADLADRFGNDYDDYRETVTCWRPNRPS